MLRFLFKLVVSFGLALLVLLFCSLYDVRFDNVAQKAGQLGRSISESRVVAKVSHWLQDRADRIGDRLPILVGRDTPAKTAGKNAGKKPDVASAKTRKAEHPHEEISSSDRRELEELLPE